jgi:transcriptional regulator with XRE-family HTH domain
MIYMTDCPGTRIKYLRTLLNMSQEELGRRVGVQRAAINKYEKGTVENIPIKTIEKIAQVFEVSPTYIVGWNNAESNPLSAEVKVLQGVQRFYGKESVELLEHFTHLNSTGKRRVHQYVEDMSLIYEDEDVLV